MINVLFQVRLTHEVLFQRPENDAQVQIIPQKAWLLSAI